MDVGTLHREITHNTEMTWVWWGKVPERRIVLTSLFRNCFSNLKKASVDKPKPRFASSISKSVNHFLLFLYFV